MARLVEALEVLGLEGDIELAGSWVRLQTEWCSVYVVEASWDRGYYTWCNVEPEQVVEFHHDPSEAIRTGLQRAARLHQRAD